MVGPDLVPTHLGTEPPAAKTGSVTVVPVVELHIQAVSGPGWGLRWVDGGCLKARTKIAHGYVRKSQNRKLKKNTSQLISIPSSFLSFFSAGVPFCPHPSRSPLCIR